MILYASSVYGLIYIKIIDGVCLFPSLWFVIPHLYASQVGGKSVDDESSCFAVSVTALEKKIDLETLSDEGPQGILKAQDESRGLSDIGDRTDISESCAAEMANVSRVPNSSVSVEKVEGLSEKGIDGSTARMQVSEESEAVIGDGMDATAGRLAVPETASIGLCSSTSANEHVECLSEKDLASNSAAGDTKQESQAAQENASKD